jgi:hypothetical protein
MTRFRACFQTENSSPTETGKPGSSPDSRVFPSRSNRSDRRCGREFRASHGRPARLPPNRQSGTRQPFCLRQSCPRKATGLAHASISVPSTLKCSSDVRLAASACSRIRSKNFCATSPSIKRSRFLLNTVGSHTGSSIFRPTNQRNNRLYCSCSINIRSLRIV